MCNSDENKTMKPMHWKESFLWFGSWAVVLIISTYGLMPRLSDAGLSEFKCFSLAMTLPMMFMLITALVVYGLESKQGLKGIRERYRMARFSVRDVAWGIGASVVGMAGMGLCAMLGTMLIDNGIIPVPGNLPLMLDPHAVLNRAAMDQMVGGKILGNWQVLLYYFIMLFFNIAGEELLWRGYILPRQELAFGRHAWWIQGIMWALYHSFKWWDIISLLPVCLVITFVAQKRKSLWPGFIAHYIVNGMGFVLFLIKVLGVD